MTPYYQDDYVTLYHSDYRDVLDEIETVELLVTDPPFFVPAEVRQSRKTWRRSIGNLGIMSTFFREMIEAVGGKLSPTGAAYVFCDSTSYPVFFASAYPIFDRTQCIVWDKNRGGLGLGWRHSHELILHCARSTTIYGSRFRRDVVFSSIVPSQERDHSSEKPLDLLTQLLRAHPSRAAVDLFAGTGTTLQAAKQLGREAIGAEIDEGMCEIAARRLEATQSRRLRSAPRPS